MVGSARIPNAQSVVVFFLVGLEVSVSAIVAEEPQSTSDQVAVARALASKGNHAEALDTVMTVLRTINDDGWNREELRRLLKDGNGWVGRLGSTERKAWLQKHHAETQANAQLLLGIAEWHDGRRAQAILRSCNVVNTAPNSVGSEMTIMYMLGVHYYSRNRPAFMRSIKNYLNAAPDNPATGWALWAHTWLRCHEGNPDVAIDLNTSAVESQPNTLASRTGSKLNNLLSAIGDGRYDDAVAILASFEEFNWTELFPEQLIDAFLMGLNVKDKTSPALTKLISTLNRVAANHGSPTIQDFGRCALSRIHERQHRVLAAVKLLEDVLNAERDLRPFEDYALSRAGAMLQSRNPGRAIEYLEEYYSKFGKSVGSEHYVALLARLYLRSGQAEKAVDVLSAADERWDQTIGTQTAKKAIKLALIEAYKATGQTAKAEAVAETIDENR